MAQRGTLGALGPRPAFRCQFAAARRCGIRRQRRSRGSRLGSRLDRAQAQGQPDLGPARDQQVFVNGRARLSLPAYSVTEYVIGAVGLAQVTAQLPRATSTAVPGAIVVPAGRPGPAGAFRWAVGYKGRKINYGWRPAAG
jgi:hypothetical protein